MGRLYLELELNLNILNFHVSQETTPKFLYSSLWKYQMPDPSQTTPLQVCFLCSKWTFGKGHTFGLREHHPNDELCGQENIFFLLAHLIRLPLYKEGYSDVIAQDATLLNGWYATILFAHMLCSHYRVIALKHVFFVLAIAIVANQNSSKFLYYVKLIKLLSNVCVDIFNCLNSFI